MKEIEALEKQVNELNTQYNEQFSVWWKLKDELTGKLGETSSCKCKKVLFLQRSRGPSGGMYDNVQKVGECETKVIKTSGEIAKAQKTGRDATVNAIEGREGLGKSMADQQHLHKLMSQKPQVDALSETKGHLEHIVKDRQQKLAKYKTTNADIRKHLKELDDTLEKCGC